MSNKLKPMVTRWYEREDTGEIFEVIAVDVADGMVDVQNFEGDVAEMDMKAWQQLNLSRVRSPKWYDRRAPYKVDRHITALNVIWDKWQQGSGATH